MKNTKNNGKIIIKKSQKSKFRYTYLSKYGCHGNDKSLGLINVILNCCQINLHKSLAAFILVFKKINPI